MPADYPPRGRKLRLHFPLRFESVVKVAAVHLDKVARTEDHLAWGCCEDILVECKFSAVGMFYDLGITVKTMLSHICHLHVNLFRRWWSSGGLFDRCLACVDDKA